MSHGFVEKTRGRIPGYHHRPGPAALLQTGFRSQVELGLPSRTVALDTVLLDQIKYVPGEHLRRRRGCGLPQVLRRRARPGTHGPNDEGSTPNHDRQTRAKPYSGPEELPVSPHHARSYVSPLPIVARASI